jgi:hypothetical protein
MFISNARDALDVAEARGRLFRDGAAAERLRTASGFRRTVAASLRRVADRLDPVALSGRRSFTPPAKEA